MQKQPKILIAIPTMGEVNVITMTVILAWMGQAMQKGDKSLQFYPTVGVSPVDRARNEIVEEFLKSDCTHLLMVDSDTIPPLDALDKLLAHDLDIVTAITPIIEHDVSRKNDSNGFYKKYNAVDMNDQFTQPNVGLIPIRGCGGSCILIKRHVFEKLPEPWFEFRNKDDTGKKTFIGEDVYFIMMAISRGFKPMADTSIICGHKKSIIW